MLDCQTVEGYLSQRLDDELDPRTRLAVDVHLRRCGVCQMAYRKMDSIRSCLERRHRVSAPEDFGHELQRRLRLMESESLLETRQTRYRLRKSLWLAGSLAACLMLSISGVVYWRAASSSRLVAHSAPTPAAPTGKSQLPSSPSPFQQSVTPAFSSRSAPLPASSRLTDLAPNPVQDDAAREPGGFDGILAQGTTSSKRSWAHVSY